jgi:hypothetical protein
VTLDPALPGERIRIAIWGTGRAGTELVKVGLTRPWVELKAGIVFAEAKDGRDLGEIAGVARLGIPATLDVGAVLRRDDIDTVLFAGLGSNQEVAMMCARALAAGKDVITVTNIYHPASALAEPGLRSVEAAAKSGGSRFVSTGLFPGFLMDVLPTATLSSIVSFEEVRCERVADMSRYGDGVLREGFKVGAPPREAKLDATFESFFAETRAVLLQSIGLELRHSTFEQEPIVSTIARETDRYRIERGTVCGHRLRLESTLSNGSRLVMQWQGTFRLQPGIDGFEPMARVTVRGYPNLDVLVTGDLFADTYPATAARGYAAVRPLRRLPPGVYHINEVPLAAVMY